MGAHREGEEVLGMAEAAGELLRRPHRLAVHQHLRGRRLDAQDDPLAAERFGVSVSSAVRWHQAWRETGTFEARSCGGSCSPLDDYAEEILALVEDLAQRGLDRRVLVMSYGEFGPDGKLVSMTGFFELPQPCELFLPDPARHRRHPCTCARRAGPH